MREPEALEWHGEIVSEKASLLKPVILKEGIERMIKEKLRTVAPLVGGVVCPAITLILTECYTHNPFTDMKLAPWLLNLAFYWLTALLLTMLTGRLRLALRLQTVCFLLMGLANYYVLAFRSSPILPWDIFSVGTAATVADNFSYALPARCWLVLAGFALLLAAEQLFPWKIQLRRLRAAGALLSLVLIVCLNCLLHQETAIAKMRLYDKMFTPGVVQKKNGCAVAFMMELKYLVVEKPDGYDAEECRYLLETYGETQEGASGQSAAPGQRDSASRKYPNLIVIMDEAFADMAYIGDITCNRDYMPFTHSLLESENTVTGRLYVSVLGGNTANTEFEFLTGNTMAFMPEGSIPYQQYIRGELPSLVSMLKEAGYASVAMHPYHASGWKREQVYAWMGFDELRFIEDYPDAEYVRKYVSDESDFRRSILEYEQRDTEKPLFVFNVTMQNHGGYDQEYENFTQDIEADGIVSQPLSAYLSLISLTDQALEELVDYFRDEEDTIILFFGDHQPNDTVAAPIWKQNGVDDRNLTWQQETLRYQVPFFLWAYFDIEEERDVEMSADFLALTLLDHARGELKGYYAYLEELRESFPVISAKQILAADGTDATGSEELPEELLTYRKLQYYRLVDAAGLARSD